jgi:threonine dehydratase
MAAGIAMAVAKLSPDCLVIGVEPSKKNLALCLKVGSRLWPNPAEYLQTKAEGLKRQQTGQLPFPILCNLLGINNIKVKRNHFKF